MKIHLIFLTLLAFLNLGIETALAEGLGVEAGVKMSGFFPTQTAGEDEIFGGLGFSGQASYETEHWGFGVRTQGSVSTRTPFHIKAGEFNFNGSLRRRQYDIEFLARYFLLDAAKNKRWYVEFAFQAIEADFIDFEKAAKGAPFETYYDINTLTPKKEALDNYNGVKKELTDLGLKFK